MAVMTTANIARNTLRPGFKAVPTDVIKAWAKENGYDVPERQGRLSNEVIDEYNKKNARRRRQYLPGGTPETKTYVYTTAAGKESTFEAVPEDVRAWATDEGLTTATKGRFSRAILDAYGHHVKPPRARKAKATANK